MYYIKYTYGGKKMYLKRSGWWYLTSNLPIPVGNNTLYYKQKINSNHPDFEKIDIKYFTAGALKHENYVPIGERGQYKEFFKTEIPPIAMEAPIVETIEKPKEEPVKVEVIEPYENRDDLNFGSEGLPEVIEPEQKEDTEIKAFVEEPKEETPKKKTNKKKKEAPKEENPEEPKTE